MNKIKYLWYRFIWNIAPFLPFGKIVHLDLELNTSCNQKCLSCWHHDGAITAHNMDENFAFATLRYAREFKKVKSVKFNLRGEPLCSPILIKCVEYANHIGYVEIMINTNGVLLTYDKIMELNRAGLTKMVISVDSFHKDTYCKIHNCDESEFRKLIDNLETLCVLYSMGKINFNTFMNIHINKYNDGQNFIEDGKMYTEYIPIVLRPTMNRMGEDIVDTVFAKWVKFLPRKNSCPHMMRRITVHATGEIYPCCVSYNNPRDIRIDSAAARRKLISDYRFGVLRETCKKCTSWDIYK